MKRRFEVATLVDAILASIAGILAAALTLVVFVLISIPMGDVLHRLGFLTDEGAAWFGLSFGIPVGLVLGILVGLYCFRKVFRYGET